MRDAPLNEKSKLCPNFRKLNNSLQIRKMLNKNAILTPLLHIEVCRSNTIPYLH